MKNWRHLVQGALAAMMMLSKILASDSSDYRLVAAQDRIWKLSESDWSFCDVTDEFKAVGSMRNVLALDYCAHPKSAGLGEIGIEVLRSGNREILLFDAAHGEVKWRVVGERPGFNWRDRQVGFFKINRETVEDAFYVGTVGKGEEHMAITGGFFEPYPTVASSRFFYVFRSSENRTLRVDARTNTVDKPPFLNRSVVLAVWGNDERFLVEDRVTKGKAVVDGSGNVICSLRIENPFAAVDFSNSGNAVYVSVARREGSVEVVDFGVYEIAHDRLNIIRRDFTVGLGKMSRSLKRTE